MRRQAINNQGIAYVGRVSHCAPGDRFHLPVPFQCWDVIAKANNHFLSSKINSAPGLSLTRCCACVLHFKVLVCTATSVPKTKASVRQLTGTSSLTGISCSSSNDRFWSTCGAILPKFRFAYCCVGLRTAIIDVGHIDNAACRTFKYGGLSQFTEFTLTHHNVLSMDDICNVIDCVSHVCHLTEPS